MKYTQRTLPLILALISFLVGIITKKWLIFGVLAAILLITYFLFYSHRKQRIRYWFQGYKAHLENGKSEREAIRATKDEFCTSKYADVDICNADYETIDALVLEIIKREYNFKIYLNSHWSSPNFHSGMVSYTKAVNKLKQEIAEVKAEAL